MTILQPYPANFRSMIFCDESSQNEKFYVVGGLYFRLDSTTDYKSEIASLEKRFIDLKAEYGLFGKVKWEKIPPATQRNKLEGYKSLIRDLATIKDIKFKCMVVDTTKYQLDSKTICFGDPLVGYLKLYCVFLTDGIMVKWPGYFYDITIDNYSFREGQDSNLLQLTDLLVGAVAFCWNGGRLRTSARSSSMKELVQVIERSYGGVKLDKNEPNGKFRVWPISIPA